MQPQRPWDDPQTRQQPPYIPSNIPPYSPLPSPPYPVGYPPPRPPSEPIARRAPRDRPFIARPTFYVTGFGGFLAGIIVVLLYLVFQRPHDRT